MCGRLKGNAAALLACHVYKYLCDDPDVPLQTLWLVDQSLHAHTCTSAVGPSAWLNHIARFVAEEHVIAAVRRVLSNLEIGPLTAILCARYCHACVAPPPKKAVGSGVVELCTRGACTQQLHQSYLYRVYYESL